MNRLLICLLPPFWLKLPPLSLSYLAASLKNQDENNSDIFIDFNSEIYQKLKTQYPQDFLIKNWESNNQNHKQFFFENLIERYPKFIDDLIDKIKKNEITHIAFSVFESNYYTTMKTIENLKKQCQNIIIIVGGPEITKILTLNKKKEIQADIWAVGEGENAIISIKNGSAKSQYYFEEIKNIDDLAYPDFTIFNLNNYKVNNCLPILMSRGCINNCSFCSEKKLYKNFKFRQHSSEYTIEMLKYLNKKFNINWFIFQDSLINANLEKLEKLCILMIDKLPNMKWEAQIYIRNDMPIELFKFLKKAGCYNLFVGLESGSDYILQKMNKRFDTNTAINFFKKCKLADLHFEISLIIGHPFETKKTIDDTKKFLIKNSDLIPKIAQINPYIYYEFSDISKDDLTPLDFDVNQEINDILNIANDCKIRYTKAFVNNLLN